MLNIKSITSCNINGNPLATCNLSKRIFEYKNFIKTNFDKENLKINDNEIVIVCVQNLYGYRTGILGYLGSLLSYKLSQYSNPTIFQTILNNIFNSNINSNDYETFAFVLSFISRKVPLINIGNWDLKKNLFESIDILNYEQPNLSIPSIFNLSSIYLLNPFFDSGCSIYSNKVPIENGFEKWNIMKNAQFSDKLYNRGINWNFFQSKNKKSGIVIINFTLINNSPDWVNSLQFEQIIKLKEKLEHTYALDVLCKKYETYIIGDFNIDFNNRNDNFEIKEQWQIFENSELQIISSEKTNFILYNNYNNYKNDKIPNYLINTNKIEEDIITHIEFENKVEEECNKEDCKEDICIESKPKDFYKVLIDIKNFYKNKLKKNENQKNISETDNQVVIEIKDNYFENNKSPSSSSSNSLDEWQTI